jgi:hypothetical protein
LRLSSHLDDDALASIWTDGSLGGTHASHPHLLGCAACRGRFTAFSSWLEDLRADAAAQADAVFPPDRLAAQHAQILRRIEAADRPARVIAFPKFSQPLSSRSSHASRWIAAAAAAGLIVGVGLGQMMDLRHPVKGSGRAAETRMAVPRPEGSESPIQSVSTTGREEAFLSELDASLSRPSVPELRALDDLTPHAGERRR